jgi:hypothetical protein
VTGGGGGRGGATLVELLLALLLSALLLGSVAHLLRVQMAAVRDLARRAEVLEAERLVRQIVPREVRVGLPGRDWALGPSDDLSLRAFRVLLRPCPGPGVEGTVEGTVEGLRAPDPAKDSALVLTSGGEWTPVAITGAERKSAECRPGPGWRLSTDPGVPDPVLVRVFERGEYSLRDGALRYRRGRSGRQPLTAGVLDPASSGFRAGPRGAVRLELHGPGGGWSRPLGGGSLP